eukprot:TRINITY_DN739_c0_g1_i4.p1 TRINITY_DN739_c0_g1~~TRINITY_DN739_c0_g1_i4.p1  ORF type:complete len:411 (+),score=120.47 TRINITY_DN739_c0_g1_i4:39-1235(+)
MLVDQRKRAIKHNEYKHATFKDPLQELKIMYTGVDVIVDRVQHGYQQGGSYMSQGGVNELVDRLDGRALLGESMQFPSRAKKERVDNNKMNFERYRTLVEAKRKGLTPEQVIQNVRLKTMEMNYAPTQKEIEREQGKKQKDGQKMPPAFATSVKFFEEIPFSQELKTNNIAKSYGINNYSRIITDNNIKAKEEYDELQALEEMKNSGLSRSEKRRIREKNRRRFKKSAIRQYGEVVGMTDSDEEYSTSSSEDGEIDGKSSPVRTTFITEIAINNDEESSSNSLAENIDIDKYYNDDDDMELEAVIRNPGDRWKFAKAIDDKFNQPRYRAYLKKEQDKTKEKEETTEAVRSAPSLEYLKKEKEKKIKNEESPQEKLMKRLRQELSETSFIILNRTLDEG